MPTATCRLASIEDDRVRGSTAHEASAMCRDPSRRGGWHSGERQVSV